MSIKSYVIIIIIILILFYWLKQINIIEVNIMSKNSIIFILILLPCIVESNEWTYDETYTDEKFYLHQLNYDFSSYTYQNWEKGLMNSKGLRLTFGSITSDDLLHYEDLIINQKLDNNWWFRINFHWYNDRNKNDEIRYIELQKAISSSASHNFYLCASGNPTHNKEESDINWGILYTNKIRSKYIQINFAWDDCIYNARNNKAGKTTQESYGIQWLMRFGEDSKWIFFTEGKYTLGFKRDYPDRSLSEIKYHQKQKNQMQGKLTYYFTSNSHLESKISYYHLSESKLFYQMENTENNYSYLNEIYQGNINYIYSFAILNKTKNNIRLRLGLNYIREYAIANGFKNYHYHREEWLPQLLIQYTYRKHTLEIGYLSTFYEWDYDTNNDINDYQRHSYIDKIKLGWTYHFNNKTQLQLSISHVMKWNGFGGGNVQYVMFF